MQLLVDRLRMPCRAMGLAAIVLCAIPVAAVVDAAQAQPQQQAQTPADAITPVEEFSRRLEEFKKSIPKLNKRIEESTSAVDRWNDVEHARKEITELRALVGAALAAVSDNGAVSQLGAKALSHARSKLAALQRDTRFKPQERQFLIDQWKQLEAETVTATTELGDAREQFANLLRTLQTNEDFIDELVEIRQARKALDVIRRLTGDIRNASDQLRKLIGAIKAPGT